jgi:hypothetical protein
LLESRTRAKPVEASQAFGEGASRERAGGLDGAGARAARAREAEGAADAAPRRMLVPTDKLLDIYDHVKHKVQAAEGSVLICVAGEVDAIAGGHFFRVRLTASQCA